MLTYGTAFGAPLPLGWLRDNETPDALAKRLADAVPAEPEDAEAHDRFGKATPIDMQSYNPPPEIQYKANYPQDEEEEGDQPEPDKPVFDLREVRRSTHKKRIENPDDPDQYVEVEVIDEITFDGGSVYFRFTLENG